MYKQSIIVNLGTLLALNKKNGKLIWKYKSNSAFEPTVAKGLVYIDEGARLIAINASTGKKVWSSLVFKGNLEESLGIFEYPAIAGNTLITLNARNYVYALDSRNGMVKWKFKVRGIIISPVIAEDVIYLADRNNIYALNMDGSLLWKINDIKSDSFFISDQKIYINTPYKDRGIIYELSER